MPASPPVTDLAVDHIEATLVELADALALDPPRTGPGRPRILPESLLWTGMVVCVLRGWSSQRDIWRLLSTTGLWQQPRVPVSDEAVYKRLAQGGTDVLETLFAQLSAALAERLAAWPALGCAELASFAPAVVALDATGLDPVLRTLPDLRGVDRGDDDLLPGALHGVFDLRTQQWRTVHYTDHPHQNEKVCATAGGRPARGQSGADGPGVLRLPPARRSDRCHVPLGHALPGRGQHETDSHLLPARGDHGPPGLAGGASRRPRQACRAPAHIPAREDLVPLLTNVTDPHQLPVADIAALYARRWDIEMAFQLVKERLGLRLLWSAKPDVVLQQVWAVLIIAQIVQALRLEIAGRAGVDPFDVSLPLVVVWLPRLAGRGVDPIATIVAEGEQIEIIRPSRRKPPPDPCIDPAAIVRAPENLAVVRKPRYRPRPAPTQAARTRTVKPAR